MGFFASLDTEGYDRQYSDKQLAQRVIVFLQPHRLRVILIAITTISLSVIGAITPLVAARGVDLVKKQPSPGNISFIFLAILLAGLLSWCVNWYRRRITVRTISSLELELRISAFSASMGHDLSFFDQYPSGKIVSRITSDTRDLANLVTLITDLISQVVQAVILGGALIYVQFRLSLILFAFLPIIFLIAISYRGIARKVTRQGMRAMANVNSAIKETVSGIAVAKNFRQEGSIFNEFAGANRQSYRVNVKRGLIMTLIWPTINTMAGFGTATLVYAGGWSVALGAITFGAWVLFLQSLDSFFFPILNLSSFWAQVQSGLSAAERVFALIDAEPAVKQIDSISIPILKGDIRFENLGFRYHEKESILENFNLYIKAGENLAVVGHTGAGKTSIARLICRFYEFQSGHLLVDGQDIRAFNLAEYRKQLGIVSQSPFLFSGTVLENICYSCENQPDLHFIEDLTHQIGNGEWLETLPQGLQTEVGERGARLSMGQRQLVALMRVIIRRPAIFILDEATASIDPFTEWQIQQALSLILANSTSILIAHRLSTVKAADRIIVINKGQIIGEGNHDGLLAQGGHYATLYNTYFRHQSLAYVEQVKTLVG